MVQSKEQSDLESDATRYFIEVDVVQQGKTVKTNGIPAHIQVEDGTVYMDRLKKFAETRLRSQALKLEQVVKQGLAIDLTFYVSNEIAGTWSQFASFYNSEQRLIFH
jgi:hypothetical protein